MSTRGTQLVAANGSRIPIQKWPGGQLFAFDDSTNTVKKVRTDICRFYNKLPCLEITTNKGRKVTVYRNQLLYSFSDGWIRADKITWGVTSIAHCLHYPIENTRTLEDAWLLGVILGGCNIALSLVRFKKRLSEDLLMHVEKAIARHAFRLAGRKGATYYLAKGNSEYSPMELLQKYKLSYFEGADKTRRVPDIIFDKSRDTIGEFIAGCIDSMGVYIPQSGFLFLKAPSINLLYDIQHLLARLNLDSSVIELDTVLAIQPAEVSRIIGICFLRTASSLGLPRRVVCSDKDEIGFGIDYSPVINIKAKELQQIYTVEILKYKAYLGNDIVMRM